MENQDQNAKNWHFKNRNKISRVKLEQYFEGKKSNLEVAAFVQEEIVAMDRCKAIDGGVV